MPRGGETMKYPAKAFGVAVTAIIASGGLPIVSAQAQCSAYSQPRPVQRTFIQRDVVEPGVYEVSRQPAVYGWIREKVVAADGSVEYVQRRVLLRPYKNVSHFQRPYIAFSRERVTVQPESPEGEGRPDC
jgi:hypothetical protein